MGTTWNPSDNAATHALSNGNNTATATSGVAGALSRAFAGVGTTEKKYWETTGNSAPGIGPIGLSVNTYPGLNTQSCMFPFSAGGLYYNAGVAVAITAPANPNTDRICWQYDGSTKTVMCRVNNGSWATLVIAGATGTMYPLTDIDNPPGFTTLFTAATDWLYTPDSGYTEIQPPKVMAAAQGSYSWAGQVVQILRSRVLGAVQGLYTWTGQAVTPTLIMPVAQGTYTWTGFAAQLLRGKILGAVQGAYVWTGQAVTLKYDRRLVAVQGTYAWVGKVTTLLRNRLAAAVQGAYSWNGNAATLTKTGNKALIAVTGYYSVVGNGAGLIYSGQGSSSQVFPNQWPGFGVRTKH
jgi:hypothetical protein